MKKLSTIIKINLIMSAIFTLLCLSFHADISLLAFPVSAACTAGLYFFAAKELVGKKSIAHLSALRRYFQYEPFVFISAFVLQRAGKFGVAYFLDLMCALVWVAVTVLSFMIQYYLGEKKVYSLNPEWGEYRKSHPIKKAAGTKRILFEILEWVDALIQAVFTIILLNIFLFQLYEIPSESMVPTFLVKDRVIVVKTLAGPKFPLSEVGLPYLQNYEKGDIIVFRNPHYADDRKSEVKTFMSQFLYMCSLTLLKTNTDENGELKADPLVKRIAAVPGEQIYMLDGTLYARTKNSPEFKPVKEDSLHAAWDLNLCDKRTKAGIEYIPLSEEHVRWTLDVEEERRNFDLNLAAQECENIAREFSGLAKKSEIALNGSVPNLFNQRDLFVAYLMNNDANETMTLMTVEGGAQWFDAFMNEWHRSNQDVLAGSLAGGDPYTDACFRLNVMSKLVAGKLILRDAQLMKENISQAFWSGDSEHVALKQKAEMLKFYILMMDMRNLSVFPKNDSDGNPSYIPENCYFMMGDNRYNSLDMRHSYEQKLAKVTQLDPYSVTYISDLAPQFVHRKKILGKASYRFWPVSRAGVPN